MSLRPRPYRPMPEDPADSEWPEQNRTFSHNCQSCGIGRSEEGDCAWCVEQMERAERRNCNCHREDVRTSCPTHPVRT